MAAYLVLKVSTDPFNDGADELTEEAIKQAWDINGVAKVERPKVNGVAKVERPKIQVCLA